MGLNVNLIKMLGVPPRVDCPKCGAIVDTHFKDYDIECGDPNPEPGLWVLMLYCDKCEHDWKMTFRIRAVPEP